MVREYSGHGTRLQPCWRSTVGLARFLHLRNGNSTYLRNGGRGTASKSLRRGSVEVYVSAAQGTYPPWESASPQLSSRFWVPEPQDLEHWRKRGGKTTSEKRHLLTISSAQSEVHGAFAFRVSVQIHGWVKKCWVLQEAGSKGMPLVSLLIMCVCSQCKMQINQSVVSSPTPLLFQVHMPDCYYDGMFAKK